MSSRRLWQALSFSCLTFIICVFSSATLRSEPSGAEATTKREPIYDVEADGKQLIAAAVKRAKAEHRRVLVEWGGNWCGWCYKLHDVFKHDELVSPIVFQEYELVLVDCNSNRELMESYGGKDTKYAFPHLTILDDSGKVLANQETGSLEDGPKHDPQKVADFLNKWRPPPVNAKDALAAALSQASEQDKRVLLHVGTPYCGWCKILSAFLSEHGTVLSKDFVDLKIDTMRMQQGEEVAARFLPPDSRGVPWMVILDGSGKVLATSVGPQGNVGYPVLPAEIDHFMSMLADTKQRLRQEDLRLLRSDLDAYRVEFEKRQAASKP